MSNTNNKSNVYTINEKKWSNDKPNDFSSYRPTSLVTPKALTIIYDDTSNGATDTINDFERNESEDVKKSTNDISKNSTVFLKFPKMSTKKKNYTLFMKNSKSNETQSFKKSNSIQRKNPNLILSWENVNVFNKKKISFLEIFKRKNSESSLNFINNNCSKDYFNKYESNLIPNDDCSVSTISYSRTSNESKSIESISSTASPSRSYKNNHILINSNFYFLKESTNMQPDSNSEYLNSNIFQFLFLFK